MGERLSWELLKEAARGHINIEVIPGLGRSDLVLSNIG